MCVFHHTLLSSEPEAIRESSKGLLGDCQPPTVSSEHQQGAPIRIQHSSGVSSEERHDIRQLSTLIVRNDSKCASTASFPVDRDIMWIRLYRV